MSETPTPTCSRCGAPIPADAPDRPCPACLMSRALAAPDPETVTRAVASRPAAREPAALPRELGGYRLLRLLGTGGMGTVYEAEHLDTGRRVALKMLAQRLDSPEMRRRFLREGRLAASVNHPNSLYVFGSEEIEGAPVITMEIAGGGTLRDVLDRRGPLPVPRAVDAVLDVISGLEAAHSAGVLHRDVKPSNCFVSPDGSVKVGDFGLSVSTLARDDSYATATGVVMGTPAYAPPEQLRGDELDVRADIYSVGATLFTLLTGRAPFEGRNAVQVVANAVNQKPTPVSALRDDVPPGLERVVARCLAKEPGGRFVDYRALRDALLPFGSREPEPASMTLRAGAGWIDFLIAFLVPYVILMLAMGNEAFHLRMFLERTLPSAAHHIAFLGFGVLYFAIAEGIFGAGPGKRLKGLRVVRADGRPPGILRGLVRILVPVLCVEAVRIPVLMASITATTVNDMTGAEVVAYSVATSLCPLIPVLLILRARRDNGFATSWDAFSGTRVVVKPEGAVRPAVPPVAPAEDAVEGAVWLGPYRLVRELRPGQWLLATDPVLRRPVWLLRRRSSGPSPARRHLARPGRPRWLQKVEMPEATWDAFEAVPGAPLSALAGNGKRVPWGTLRHWLHDLATEMWAASADHTLPAALGLDHVWITVQGRALLLDEPWPEVLSREEPMDVGDVAAQQRFLGALAACVESRSLPLHARPVLRNLVAGKFEKLSFLTGTLRGLLDRPAEVGRGVRAGSIFLLPVYAWIMCFVGMYAGEGPLVDALGRDSVAWLVVTTAMLVLIASAVVQILVLPFRTSGHLSLFRLAVVNAAGEPARGRELLARWAIVWLPLLLPMAAVALLMERAGQAALVAALTLLVLWVAAGLGAVADPARGWHDRLAGTWVVRR